VTGIEVVIVFLTIGSGLIDRIFLRQAVVEEKLAGVSYQADFTYLESDLRGKSSHKIWCRRRVIMSNYEEQQDICISGSVDGRPAEGQELRQLCWNLQKTGLIARRSRLPFFIAARNEYEYDILGVEEVNGESAWVIRFLPKRSDSQHLRGRGYVRVKGYDVVRLEFVPAQLPFVVEKARMVLDYSPVDGFYLPCRFWLEMDLRLKVFKELLHRRIEVEDVYYDYSLRLNRGGF
jgi:hypothetical protein